MSNNKSSRNKTKGSTNTTKDTRDRRVSSARPSKGDTMESGKMSNPDNLANCGYEHPTNNDPTWYDKYGLMAAAANISMYNPTGMKVDLTTADYSQTVGTATASTPALFRIPGIMTFDTAYGPGIADDVNSAINVAAQSIYTYVRHWNSGAANYEKADLMQYILLVESAWVMYWQGVRAYSAMNAVNTVNRYVPRFVTTALGFDYDDLTNKLLMFRSILDQFAVRISRYVIPSDLTYAKRLDYLFSNIFTDGTSPKSQFYIYNPAGYFTFGLEGDSEPHPGAGKLIWNWFNTYDGSEPKQHTPWTVEAYGNLLNTIAENLEDQEDFGIMSGDILKAYPQNAIKVMGVIPDGLVMQPIYDLYALEQIHNSTISGYPIVQDVTDNSIVYNWNILQNPDINGGELTYKPIVSMTQILPPSMNPIYGKRIIDFHRDNVNFLDITEATRSMVTIKKPHDPGNVQKGYAIVTSAGAEILVRGRVWTIDSTGSIVESAFYTENDFNTIDTDTVTDVVASAAKFIARMANISQFDYAPHSFLLTGYMAAEYDLEGIALFSDIDNYTVIDPEVLNNIHSAALLSLFKINI